MSNDRSSRRAAALGLTAGLVGGGAAGLVIGVPGISTAASDAAAGIVVAQTDVESGSESDVDRRSEMADRLREALQALVDDGTVTADQADAVAEHLTDGARVGRRAGPRHRVPGVGVVADRSRLDEIAETLGIDDQELADELRSGSTLADVATEHGVDPADIVEILIADRIARIDDAVAEGELDALAAAERKEEIEERATAHVNGEHPAFGRNGGPGRRPAVDADTEPDGVD